MGVVSAALHQPDQVSHREGKGTNRHPSESSKEDKRSEVQKIGPRCCRSSVRK